jgi:nicotinamidase-related amidase
MLYNKTVPIGESALIVVDVQDSFKLGPRWETRNNKQFEDKMARLIAAYREHARPVVFIMHSDDDEGFCTDSPEYKLMDFVDRSPDEPIFHKVTRNAFTSTGLGAYLLEKGIRRIAISGITMEQCCETTTRVAADLGYKVDFVIDATVTFPITHPTIPGRILSVEDVEERTVYTLGGRFATIMTVAELEEELSQSRQPVSSGA